MLYFVVVSNEKVASQLLEKGQLQKRVTIIPLTKIQPPNVDPKVLLLGCVIF
jgi:structural maintenance of chromosome 2